MNQFNYLRPQIVGKPPVLTIRKRPNCITYQNQQEAYQQSRKGAMLHLPPIIVLLVIKSLIEVLFVFTWVQPSSSNKLVLVNQAPVLVPLHMVLTPVQRMGKGTHLHTPWCFLDFITPHVLPLLKTIKAKRLVVMCLKRNVGLQQHNIIPIVTIISFSCLNTLFSKEILVAVIVITVITKVVASRVIKLAMSWCTSEEPPNISHSGSFSKCCVLFVLRKDNS